MWNSIIRKKQKKQNLNVSLPDTREVDELSRKNT